MGIWNLHVTAFMDDEEEGAAIKTERGSLWGIEIPSGETVAGKIVLSPIAGGKGTFIWDICFDEEYITAANMKITQIGENVDLTGGLFPLSATTGSQSTDRIALSCLRDNTVWFLPCTTPRGTGRY